MNFDTLLFIFPAITIFLFAYGFYVFIMERRVKAHENIKSLISSEVDQQKVDLAKKRQSSQVLKKRNKDEKSFFAQLEAQLERANLLLRADEFILICLGFGVLSFLICLVVMRHAFALCLAEGLAGSFIPYLYIRLRIWMRIRKAAEQFADVLDALVSCFKTGFGFNRAVHTISDNFEDPWGTEFGKMSAELSLGATQEDVMNNLRRRLPLADVELFITAMNIQKETGGNLTELLAILSKTIRDRYKLFQKIGAISAQGKLSAAIICCVPFLLTGIMFMFLPDATIEFVTNPIGIAILSVTGIWMCFGIGVLFKIVQIEV
jgi:tight adherence protein B